MMTLKINPRVKEMAAKISRQAGEETIQKTNLKTNLKILDLIRQNPGITAEDLVQVTGLSLAGVKYNLSKLKKESLLKRIGPDKSGHWEVAK